jgi:hypothetical protein
VGGEVIEESKGEFNTVAPHQLIAGLEVYKMRFYSPRYDAFPPRYDKFFSQPIQIVFHFD